MQNGFDADRFHGDVIEIKGVDAVGQPIEFSFEVDDKMVEDVQSYLDICRADVEPGDQYWTEQRFDLSDLHPGMFGTSDWCCYKVKERRLIVRDYKNGFGLVNVVDNPQLKFYGLGALRVVAKQGFKVDTVTLGVVQPNAPHINGPSREWSIDALDLIDFEMELVAAARKTEDPNAPRTAGDHCEYCLAADDCPALTAVQNMLASADFEPIATIEVQKLTQLLDAATMMEARIGAAWALAQRMAEAGVQIPGYKLVERNTRRKYREDDKEIVAAKLKEKYGFQNSDIYEPKLKTPAKIEKLIKAPRGKKEEALREFNFEFVVRPPGGNVLVRDVDPRTTLTASNPADDFDAIETPKPVLLF